MRSTINLGFVAAVSAATVQSAPQGYLAVVGPKPLMFAKPAIPLALAISRLPSLATVTPDPRIRHASATNESVILPPPGSSTNTVANPNVGSGSSTAEAGSVPAGPGQDESQGPPADPFGGGAPGGFPIHGGLKAPGDPGSQSDRVLPLLSLQMLVPFFRDPATTNRTNPILLSVPFQPGQPAVPGPVPAPAASSTATYEQH